MTLAVPDKFAPCQGKALSGRQLHRLTCVPYEGTWFARSFGIRPLIRSTSPMGCFTGELSNRGDSSRLPSSATGSGRREELPTSLFSWLKPLDF